MKGSQNTSNYYHIMTNHVVHICANQDDHSMGAISRTLNYLNRLSTIYIYIQQVCNWCLSLKLSPTVCLFSFFILFQQHFNCHDVMRVDNLNIHVYNKLTDNIRGIEQMSANPHEVLISERESRFVVRRRNHYNIPEILLNSRVRILKNKLSFIYYHISTC